MASTKDFYADDADLFSDDEDARARRSGDAGGFDADFDPDAHRDAVVMLIDASPAMFRADKTREGGACAFTAAARACFEFTRARIVVAPDDVVGACAYNTSGSLGGYNFPRVSVVQAADAPSASGALELSEYADGEAGVKKFREKFGVLSPDDDVNQEDALTNGLWTASNMLESGPKRAAGRKSVYLFTNEDSPLRPGNLAGQKLIARAKEMSALGQRIEVLSLTRDGAFDSSVFYDEFTAEHCGAAEGERALVVVNDGTELQREFLKKSRKRRRLKQTKLWLVPGKIGVPVGVYSLVSEAKKATSILVDGKDLGEIRREQTYICKDTGATIEKPTKSFVEYDGERLVFSNKELAVMRKVKFGNVTGAASVGFHLVGFMSADKITRDLTLKKSHFIAGEGGGCTAFQGLLRACVQENKVALCAFARGERAPMRFVALIPQLAPGENRAALAKTTTTSDGNAGGGFGDGDEEDDDDDAVSRLDPPEGFHVFYLPFRDDVRQPERAVASANAPLPRASEEQIASAAKVIDAIRLVKWHPKQTPNPALQTHHRILEMCALERVEMEPVHDDTAPNYSDWQRVGVPALLHDYDARCFAHVRALGADSSPPTFPAKRKADAAAEIQSGRSPDSPPPSSSRRAASTRPIEPRVLPEHAKTLDHVRAGTLADLTADKLRHFLAAHGLTVSGSKRDLRARVESHVRAYAPDAIGAFPIGAIDPEL